MDLTYRKNTGRNFLSNVAVGEEKYLTFPVCIITFLYKSSSILLYDSRAVYILLIVQTLALAYIKVWMETKLLETDEYFIFKYYSFGPLCAIQRICGHFSWFQYVVKLKSTTLGWPLTLDRFDYFCWHWFFIRIIRLMYMWFTHICFKYSPKQSCFNPHFSVF